MRKDTRRRMREAIFPGVDPSEAHPSPVKVNSRLDAKLIIEIPQRRNRFIAEIGCFSAAGRAADSLSLSLSLGRGISAVSLQ